MFDIQTGNRLGRITSTSRRPRFLVLIALGIVCLATYMYYGAVFQQKHRRHLVRVASVIASKTSAEKQQQQQSESGVVSLVTVQSTGRFLDRVAALNAFLSAWRADELRRRGSAVWQSPGSSRLNVVRGARDDYMELLSKYSSVVTVTLPWLKDSSDILSVWNSLQDRSNLLLQTYYEWTADDKLCTFIETPGNREMSYDAVYNRSCNRNINDTVQPSSLQPLFLNGKAINRNNYFPNNGNSYPAHFYTSTPLNVSYMHIHRDAIVTTLGDVITEGLKLVLYSCSNDVNPVLPQYSTNAPLYGEVFVVSQLWGTSVFHRMAEVVPRIALFVDFLKSNPEIRIVASETGGRLGELVEILGLPRTRLVTGIVRARIVYQPRTTGCGFPNVAESQMLSHLYRDYIRQTFPPQPRNRLILIRRSGTRRFTEQEGIEKALENAAKDYNLTYTLFVDNPTPSLNETMLMFHSATMIVAPLGAGEANMYFSQPGTYVVEGVCNPPHVNLCFQRLAHILGHHWHGIMSRGGCLNLVSVSIREVDVVVRKFLQLWKNRRKL